MNVAMRCGSTKIHRVVEKLRVVCWLMIELLWGK